MTKHNEALPALQRTQLQIYRSVGTMPDVHDDANLHACAHLYASDRNSLFIIPNHFDASNDYDKIASLSHSVVFHVPAKSIDMGGASDGPRRWYTQEAWTSRVNGVRGMHGSRIWDDRGLNIASTWQEGLVRFTAEGVKKIKRAHGIKAVL